MIQGTKRAEITIYLSLVFILLLSLSASLIESASIQNAKNYRRADVNRSLESAFAEYQKEMLERYDIFALEGSYESGVYSEALFFNRLAYYGTSSVEHQVKRIQLLTDNGCQPFYDQIAAYMRHKYGLSAGEDKLGSSVLWKQEQEKAERFEREGKEEQDGLDTLLKEHEAELPSDDNPIAHMKELKQIPLLELVVPKEIQLSEKSVRGAALPSQRTLRQGYGSFQDVEETKGPLSQLLMGEYLMEHFTTLTDEKKTGGLDYEIEYILSGKQSDKENLEEIVKQLMLIRFAPNYLYLQSDSMMKAEAQAMALTLCTLVALPIASEAVAQGILLAWAFGESVIDIRALFSGSKVAAVKTRESWQLQLSSLLKLGTQEDQTTGQDYAGGLDYKAYMQMLLFLESEATVGIRSLDMIEHTLTQEKGLTFYKADQCISRVEITSTCQLRRGVIYRFDTYFGYN